MGEHKGTITLISYTCRKGHVSAFLKGADVDCPYCLERRVEQSEQYADDLLTDNGKLKRTISALKGALTKKKK